MPKSLFIGCAVVAESYRDKFDHWYRACLCTRHKVAPAQEHGA